MIPSGSIPTGSASSSPNSLHSNLLSASGMTDVAPENAMQEKSPADSAIETIGGFLQNFRSITDSFPGVGEAEKQIVEAAIGKYMEKVVGSLNSSPSAQSAGGGLPAY